MAPYKSLAVGPCSSGDVRDGPNLGAKLLYYYLPSDMPSADARQRVSVAGCKFRGSPARQTLTALPKFLQARLTHLVQNKTTKKPACDAIIGRRFGAPLTS